MKTSPGSCRPGMSGLGVKARIFGLGLEVYGLGLERGLAARGLGIVT